VMLIRVWRLAFGVWGLAFWGLAFGGKKAIRRVVATAFEDDDDEDDGFACGLA
jgi:hypothetical protein